MLRLRAYEKLQNLVRQGQVKKTGKRYKGITDALLLLGESLKEFRNRRPSFSPKAVARSPMTAPQDVRNLRRTLDFRRIAVSQKIEQTSGTIFTALTH